MLYDDENPLLYHHETIYKSKLGYLFSDGVALKIWRKNLYL
jgi:hypothetical protein